MLTAEELSARWGGSPTVGTLKQWRYRGQGPRYRRIGRRVVYPLRFVEAFEKKGERGAA